DAPRRRVDEAQGHADGRRLAGAVRAEEAKDLAAIDGQVDAGDGADGAILFGQVKGLQDDFVHWVHLVLVDSYRVAGGRGRQTGLQAEREWAGRPVLGWSGGQVAGDRGRRVGPGERGPTARRYRFRDGSNVLCRREWGFRRGRR